MRQLEIERDDVTLVLDTQGPRKGPTLLFLHASGESRTVWTPLFSQLRPKHWQLAAPDLRGHGDSGRSKAYRVDDFIKDGYQIINRLKGRPLVIVGSSVGGLLALLLAKQYPLLIDGLVLLDAPSYATPPAVEHDSQSFMNTITKKLNAFSFVDPQLASGQLEREILAEPARLAEAARSVSVPTLYMYGSRGTGMGENTVEQLRRDIPHVEIGEVDASSARENSKVVSDRIASFVPTLIPEIIH
ncbi:alpha/beta hydrolase [Proteobacteria bacterium 005FR1]|nr:alpha/beta hydrolase [Proteobacteria bacterium 005FR1]